MNDEPEMPAEQPDEQDRTLFDLNAELAKLIEQEKEKQEKAQSQANGNSDPLGNPRLATLSVSHDEIHALGTSVKMLFQFCSMALITGNNTPDEIKEWQERQTTLLDLKNQIIQQHNAFYQNDCDDDDDDECDHDH